MDSRDPVDRTQADPEPAEHGKLGSVQVSPAVLATLARMTATNVPGVISVGKPLPRLLRWLPCRRRTLGVSVEIRDDGAHAAIEIVVEQGRNIIETATRAQSEIGIAIEKMVGVPVREVNVLVLDVR